MEQQPLAASSSQTLAPLSASSSSGVSFPTLPPSRTMSNTSSASSAGAPTRSTTSTPVSQPRPTSTASARGASSAFDFLFGPTPASTTNGSSVASQTKHKSTEAISDASNVDKGKAVAPSTEEAGASEPDAIQRQAQVDKILKRAEAAKLARAFRNRLALASFKTSRGWQDVSLDVIEPHLRDEALKRQQSTTPEAPPDHSTFPSKPSPVPVLAAAPTAQPPPRDPSPPADQPYKYQINYNARPLDMDAVVSGSGGGGAHKRTRSIDPGYNQVSPYGSNPRGSPYSTDNVYRAAKMQESPTKRRHMEGTTPRQRQKSAGGSRRSTPLRQNPNGTPAKPLSASDPAFSSFVDAAAALTGMARAPSDPSMSGSEEEVHHARHYDAPYATGPGVEPYGRTQPRLSASLPAGTVIQSIPHPPHHHHAFPQLDALPVSQSQASPFPSHPASSNGHPSQNYLYASLPLPSEANTPPVRPVTPDKLKASGGGGGRGAAGSGDNSEVAAADLMLFLAHSPSPVQTRKPQTTLGDGSGMKGRRLFGVEDDGDEAPSGSTNGNGLAQSVFGGGLDAFSPSRAPPLSRSTSTSSPFITSSGPSTARTLDAPFDPTSSTSSAPRPLTSFDSDPSKPSSGPFFSSALTPAAAPLGLDPTAASDPHLAFPAPGTPRQRQPSFNGGQGWESFINASPSPTRATIPRGDTPPGLTGGEGGRGVRGDTGDDAAIA